MTYDCIIIGGGIAGLQAAIQLGRYRRNVAIIDSDNGRSSRCRNYHNILGWPDGVSGKELRRLGREQATLYGVQFIADTVAQVSLGTDEDGDSSFQLMCTSGVTYEARRVLFATGIVDNIPAIDGIEACLGNCVYVCPDCDGYEIMGLRTVIIGAGRVGAEMALTLSYFQTNLLFVNHATTPLPPDLHGELARSNIEYTVGTVTSVEASDDGLQLQSVILADGRTLPADRGFVAFGGNRVNSHLAQALGVNTLENGHIPVDARTKMTNIEHVYAAGDVVAHSEQTTIAMGDGAQAAIWIHKSLLRKSETS